MELFLVLKGLALTWTQILGVIILVVLYGLNSSYARNHATNVQERHVTCDSPGCVRCTAYTARPVEDLRKRWTNYTRQALDLAGKESVARVTETMSRHVSANGVKQRSFELLHLKTSPFHDRKLFAGDISLLEANWKKIYDEYILVKEKNGLWKKNATPSGMWKAFYLVNQGNEIEESVSRCPMTRNVLKGLQYFMSDCIFGNACFSVVYPQTHIAEHCGPCNLRVRCHLGLDIPDECELIVDKKRVFWESGKCVLFDDYYLHSVTHRGSRATSKPRVVFLIDFWNRDISQAERRGLEYLLHSGSLFPASERRRKMS